MKNKKIALIFGITGQDVSYLAELLLNKNYIVHGVKRRSSSFNTGRIDHLYHEVMIFNKPSITLRLVSLVAAFGKVGLING